MKPWTQPIPEGEPSEVDGSAWDRLPPAPSAMVERLVQAAIDYERAEGMYVAGARREFNEARGAVEAALANATELSGALKAVVEIDERDETCDPDRIATESWREEAWTKARAVLAKVRHS